MRKLGKIKIKNKSGKLFMQFFCFSKYLSNIFFLNTLSLDENFPKLESKKNAFF